MRRDSFWKDRLSVAICLWLCTTPFLFFLAVTFFGVQVAWISVTVSFVIILAVCNMICRFQRHEEARVKWLNKKRAK